MTFSAEAISIVKFVPPGDVSSEINGDVSSEINRAVGGFFETNKCCGLA